MYQESVIPGMDPESRPLNRSCYPYSKLDSRFTVRAAGCPGMTRQGFTLIELLVVVLIIGILASVALPQYQKAVLKSRLIQGYLWFNKLEDAQKVFYLANGRYAASADELDLDFTTAANSSFTVDAWSAAHYVTIKDQRFRVSWEFNYDNARGTYGKYCFFSPGLSNAKYIRQICQDLGGAYSHANAANEYFVFPDR